MLFNFEISFSNFFKDESLLLTFTAIEMKNFDADAIKFVNILNESCSTAAKVWTYPCTTAQVIIFSTVMVVELTTLDNLYLNPFCNLKLYLIFIQRINLN